jgi:hypothetical protein
MTLPVITLGWGLLGLIAGTTSILIAHRREANHGRNRRTQEDHPDPQASGTTLANGGTIALSADLSSFFPGQLLPVAVERPALDTVHDDVPILAHRAARLRTARGGLTLATLNRKTGDKPVTFGIDEDAKCYCGMDQLSTWVASYTTTTSNLNFGRIGSKHSVVPAVDGHCGWYAVPSDVDAWHEPNTVDLLVELSGRVIEHEKGYRAEHQRVIEIGLPGCWLCGQPSTHALFDTDECQRFACGNHLAPGLTAICADDIQLVLGVPVVEQQT